MSTNKKDYHARMRVLGVAKSHRDRDVKMDGSWFCDCLTCKEAREMFPKMTKEDGAKVVVIDSLTTVVAEKPPEVEVYPTCVKRHSKVPPPPKKDLFHDLDLNEREKKIAYLGYLKGVAVKSTGWQKGAAWKRYYDEAKKLKGEGESEDA